MHTLSYDKGHQEKLTKGMKSDRAGDSCQKNAKIFKKCESGKEEVEVQDLRRMYV